MKAQKTTVKKVTIADKSDATLLSELTELTAKITEGIISFKNAKKVVKTCPYSAFNHTGRICVDKAINPEIHEAAMSVVFKVRDEAEKRGDIAAAKATHNVKAATCSATIRSVGMDATKSPVTAILAAVQKLHQAKRIIELELANRKLQAELKAKADAISAMEYGTAVKAA